MSQQQVIRIVNGNPQWNYLINSSSAPTRRSDGTPLQDGDLWFDVDYGMNRTYLSGVWRAPGVYENGTSFSAASSTTIAANSTSGFLLIPTLAGAPTGTPAIDAGQSALAYDPAALKLYVYNVTGGWKSVTVA